jgi:cyclopropane fatty-acyl-phospholipid synthase-like methyltransferase
VIFDAGRLTLSICGQNGVPVTALQAASEPANEPSHVRPASQRKSADWWDQFWQRPPAATGRRLTCQRTAEETLRLLAPELANLSTGQRLRVLDLGCGPGDLTPLILEEPRLEIVALDLSAGALGQFRARLGQQVPDRLTLARASVYELPFADGAFDAVVSFGYASAASYAGAE